MALIHLTNEAFDKATASGLAMVDFWATWCGPCKMLSPVIDGLADRYEGKVLVGKVNTDATPTRPLRSAGTSTRITHPSTSKCAVFQAYSNKPATLPLFKIEKPTHHYRRVGFTFAILCFLCVMNDLVKGIELRFVFCRMIDNFLVKSVFRK